MTDLALSMCSGSLDKSFRSAGSRRSCSQLIDQASRSALSQHQHAQTSSTTSQTQSRTILKSFTLTMCDKSSSMFLLDKRSPNSLATCLSLNKAKSIHKSPERRLHKGCAIPLWCRRNSYAIRLSQPSGSRPATRSDSYSAMHLRR